MHYSWVHCGGLNEKYVTQAHIFKHFEVVIRSYEVQSCQRKSITAVVCGSLYSEPSPTLPCFLVATADIISQLLPQCLPLCLFTVWTLQFQCLPLCLFTLWTLQLQYLPPCIPHHYGCSSSSTCHRACSIIMDAPTPIPAALPGPSLWTLSLEPKQM